MTALLSDQKRQVSIKDRDYAEPKPTKPAGRNDFRQDIGIIHSSA